MRSVTSLEALILYVVGGVRELGPGKYIGRDGKVDFINQTGNIKVRYKFGISHLFVLETARRCIC